LNLFIRLAEMLAEVVLNARGAKTKIAEFVAKVPNC
jgi:hypothetical protein